MKIRKEIEKKRVNERKKERSGNKVKGERRGVQLKRSYATVYFIVAYKPSHVDIGLELKLLQANLAKK